MTDNIIQMPTPKHVLFERYRAGYKRAEGGRAEWIAGVLEMAAALCELRDQYNNNQAFSLAIAEAGLGFHNDQDRAALINMQRNRELTEIVLRETKRTSLQLIWIEEIQPSVANASNTPPGSHSTAETSIQDATMTHCDKSVVQTASDAEMVPPPNNNSMAGSSPPPRRKIAVERSTYASAPRAEEIAKRFQNARGRDILAKVWTKHGTGKKIWDMLIVAYDAGLLVPNDTVLKFPTLRLLFPLAPNKYSMQFNLFDKKQLAHVSETILPAMIACKDQLLADPERTQEIVNEYLKTKQVQQKQAVIIKKHAVAVKAMAVTEQELVMFGHPVWPRLDTSQGEYDYDQVRAAIWFFREYQEVNVLAKENIKSLGMRNSQLASLPQ